jgi:hypothetical protein
VGIAVGIRVSVGSDVGSGRGVDVKPGRSGAAGANVAGLAPQAVTTNDKTIITDKYKSKFFIG